MLKPQRLRSGDKVAVVAPASGFLREEFDKGIAAKFVLDPHGVLATG